MNVWILRQLLGEYSNQKLITWMKTPVSSGNNYWILDLTMTDWEPVQLLYTLSNGPTSLISIKLYGTVVNTKTKLSRKKSWLDVLRARLKTCVRYFLFFPLIKPLKNYEKCFLLHLKWFFCSWNIQTFVFWSFLLSSPVLHGYRR